MPAEQVTISIDEAHRDRFTEIVHQCERQGLKVEQQLREIGVVVGRIDAARRRQLEHVPGVAFVETARRVQIPPPESELQ